jgi:LmbE family N-acetylglucosaminyl deacetylase
MSGLLVVLAHPDDESMGTGGLILRHSRADVEVNLICATRGEKGRCTDAAVAAAPDAARPALYHMAIDAPLADAYRAAIALNGPDGGTLPLVVKDHVDFVLELTAEEVQMKLRAIDCHQSQLETWRVEIRNHPHLMQNVYGREPYIALSAVARPLTGGGLLGEFA